MKILHYVSGFHNGGIETMLVNLVNEQIKSNDVAIVILTDNILDGLIKKVNKSVKIFKIGKPVRSKNPIYVLKANYYYHIYKPNIFHFHVQGASTFFPHLMMDDKRLVTLHSMEPTIYESTIDMYIAISECVRSHFLKDTGKTNCCLCYNGIKLDRFKKKVKYNTKPLRFLSIGRLYPSKGMDILVKAFIWLKQEGFNYDLELDIWGGGQEYDNLKTLIENNELREIVHLCGNKDNSYVERHICDYDCVIQASRHEGFGLTAIEAMVCGVPTILSNIDGYSEVSQNGQYSLLFDTEDPISLGKKILFMREKYQVAINKAILAYQYVYANFSIERLTEELNKIYQIANE